jgi:hypothetical protein
MFVHFLVHEVQFGGCSNCDYWRGSFILMTQGNRGGVSWHITLLRQEYKSLMAAN